MLFGFKLEHCALFMIVAFAGCRETNNPSPRQYAIRADNRPVRYEIDDTSLTRSFLEEHTGMGLPESAAEVRHIYDGRLGESYEKVWFTITEKAARFDYLADLASQLPPFYPRDKSTEEKHPYLYLVITKDNSRIDHIYPQAWDQVGFQELAKYEFNFSKKGSVLQRMEVDTATGKMYFFRETF